MMPTLPRARIRTTTSTERRCDNLRRLIARLRDGEMLRDDIASFLGYGPSGTRKYLHDLRDSGVIELARYVDGTATYLGHPVYQLNGNEEAINEFLAALSAPKPGRAIAAVVKHAVDPTRHVHLARDDVPYMPRLERDRPARRDPLVAFLFGDAGEVA